MSWRKFEDHKAETKAVKKFMAATYPDVSVGHGHGTAWSWLKVSFSIPRPANCYCDDAERREGEFGLSCLNCGHEYSRVYNQTSKELMQFTGRTGEYHGNITINIDWLPATVIPKPITKPVDEKEYLYGYGRDY